MSALSRLGLECRMLAFCTALLCIAVSSSGCSPLPPRTQPPCGRSHPALEKLLTAIRAADKGQLAVSEEDGRFLRTLVASTNAKQVLEIGAASGYSGIWMGLGLRETGGRLTTIEYDPVRAKEAAANIQRAGLADIVQVIPGDAFAEIPKLTGTSISCSSTPGSPTTRSSSTWCSRGSRPAGCSSRTT